ncbi:hypothetical protein HK101_003786 [Irineochytrium annulatum]|nr:hypothetical protein HK101_003786 [Irineochytrium annulatum]
MERDEVPTQNLSDEFCIRKRFYTQQFAGLYFTRLNLLRPRALKEAHRKWANVPVGPNQSRARFVERVLDITAGPVCYLVGTVFVDMPLKPSVLDEITNENGLAAIPPRIKYFSEKDMVLLEDESGRVQLCGEIVRNDLFVTGTIIGVLGVETDDGGFEVLDVCYPAATDQPARTPTSVSGLSIEGSGISLEHQLLVDYLSGELGIESVCSILLRQFLFEQNQANSAKVIRLIVVGNTFPEKGPPEAAVLGNLPKKPTPTPRVSPTAGVDAVLSALTSTLPLDVLPGADDPTNFSLPQQAMHRAMFSRASRFTSFNLVTNPYMADIDGVRCLAISGQNIDDLCRYVDVDDRLDLAEKTLTWSHLAPSAPDTLWCYPFRDSDPFVIDALPHIYIVGNQPKFETRLVKGVQ